MGSAGFVRHSVRFLWNRGRNEKKVCFGFAFCVSIRLWESPFNAPISEKQDKPTVAARLQIAAFRDHKIVLWNRILLDT